MSQLTIKKATLKDNMFLEVEFTEHADGSTDIVKKNCSAVVHDDLKSALKRLNIHLALMCEQVQTATGKGSMDVISALGEVAEGLDPDHDFSFTQAGWDLVHKIFCKSVSISTNADNEGVTLSGYRELSNGKILNLVSPHTKYEDERIQYDYSSELSEIVEAVKNEVILYLEGKHQPKAQMSLEFDDTEEEINN